MSPKEQLAAWDRAVKAWRDSMRLREWAPGYFCAIECLIGSFLATPTEVGHGL